jgi:hypothetical protein
MFVPLCLLCEAPTIAALAMYTAVRLLDVESPPPGDWKVVLQLEDNRELYGRCISHLFLLYSTIDFVKVSGTAFFPCLCNSKSRDDS